VELVGLPIDLLALRACARLQHFKSAPQRGGSEARRKLGRTPDSGH